LTVPPLVVPLDELLPVPLDVAPLEEELLDDALPDDDEDVLDVELLPPVPEEDELVVPPVPWPPFASWYLPKS